MCELKIISECLWKAEEEKEEGKKISFEAVERKHRIRTTSIPVGSLEKCRVIFFLFFKSYPKCN